MSRLGNQLHGYNALIPMIIIKHGKEAFSPSEWQELHLDKEDVTSVGVTLTSRMSPLRSSMLLVLT